jgi:hypothetical protein
VFPRDDVDVSTVAEGIAGAGGPDGFNSIKLNQKHNSKETAEYVLERRSCAVAAARPAARGRGASGIRWTEGDASVPAALFDGPDDACNLELLVAGSTRYRWHTIAVSPPSAVN